MTNANKTSTVSAEIALYGNREVGFGYLATVEGKFGQTCIIAGDGQPRVGTLLTDCLFSGRQALERQGVDGKATVAIYAPGGERVAYLPLRKISNFGAIPGTAWQAAPVYVLSAAEILRAAEQPVAGYRPGRTEDELSSIEAADAF